MRSTNWVGMTLRSTVAEPDRPDNDAAAVDQDQRAVRTEVAKIDRGDAARPR